MPHDLRDLAKADCEDAVAAPAPRRPALEIRGAPLDLEVALYGFPHCLRFTLRSTPRPGLYWLQSIDHVPLRFLLVDPFLAVDGYSIDLAELDVERLGPAAPGDIAVLAIVTRPPDDDRPRSVNLQAPIALNVRTGRGLQMIVDDAMPASRQTIRIERLLSTAFVDAMTPIS